MNIHTIIFSATGVTKKVVKAVAEGVKESVGLEDGNVKIMEHNFTTPAGRNSIPEVGAADIAIVGTPVYAGRVPNLLLKYLRSLEGNGALAIPIVTYGNRNFDDALAELNDLLIETHFRPIAAGAFVGQHSFSNTLAAGRPDAKDLAQASELGKTAGQIAGQIISLQTLQREYSAGQSLQREYSAGQSLQGEYSAGQSLQGAYTPGQDQNMLSIPGRDASHEPILQPTTIPGRDASTRVYYQPKDSDGNPIDIRKVKPKSSDQCNSCGHCAEICPMGAIDVTDPRIITGICIKCNACIKECPQQAKYFDDPGYLFHKEDLENRFTAHQSNTIILPIL